MGVFQVIHDRDTSLNVEVCFHANHSLHGEPGVPDLVFLSICESQGGPVIPNVYDAPYHVNVILIEFPEVVVRVWTEINHFLSREEIEMGLGGDLHREVDAFLPDAEQRINGLKHLWTDSREMKSEGRPGLLVVLNIKSLKPLKTLYILILP